MKQLKQLGVFFSGQLATYPYLLPQIKLCDATCLLADKIINQQVDEAENPRGARVVGRLIAMLDARLEEVFHRLLSGAARYRSDVWDAETEANEAKFAAEGGC